MGGSEKEPMLMSESVDELKIVESVGSEATVEALRTA